MTDHPKILLKREVLALTRLHKDTIWRLESKNMFPEADQDRREESGLDRGRGRRLAGRRMAERLRRGQLITKPRLPFEQRHRGDTIHQLPRGRSS